MKVRNLYGVFLPAITIILASFFALSGSVKSEVVPKCTSVRNCAEKMLVLAAELKEENLTLEKQIEVLRKELASAQKKIDKQKQRISGLGIGYQCKFSNVATGRSASNGKFCGYNANHPIESFSVRLMGKGN